MPRALAVNPDRRKFCRIDKSRERELACVRGFEGVCIRAMPQLASYLRAIGCRAAISSDRITARLANGPGLPAPRGTFPPSSFPQFSRYSSLVSVTTITLIIALRRTVPSRLPSCCSSVGNFQLPT